MASDMEPLPVEAGTVELVTGEGWEPRNEGDVETALRILDRAAFRFGEIRARAAAWRSEIDEWERREAARFVAPATRAVLAVESWALAQRRLTGTKTFRYPSGTVETKAGRDRVTVTDEEKLLAWCRVNCPDAVKVETSILVSKLPEHTVADGRMVDARTGEVVPGVQVASGSNYASASVKLASARELPKGS